MLMLLEGLNLKKAVLYCGKQAASEKLIIQKCGFWRLISSLLQFYLVFATTHCLGTKSYESCLVKPEFCNSGGWVKSILDSAKVRKGKQI